jgi:hypothetical protein
MNADGAGFPGGDASEGFGVLQLAGSAEGHRVREVRRTHQARGDSALKISGEEQGELRLFLQAVEQFCGFVGFTAQKNRPIDVDRHGEGAHVKSLHGVKQLQVFGALDIQEAGTAPDHEELADFLFRTQFVQRLLRPLVTRAGVADWGGSF